MRMIVLWQMIADMSRQQFQFLCVRQTHRAAKSNRHFLFKQRLRVVERGFTLGKVHYVLRVSSTVRSFVMSFARLKLSRCFASIALFTFPLKDIL